MNESVEAFPLQWPAGWPRTKGYRNSAPYKVVGDKARLELMGELRMLGAIDVVISSNIPLRMDGAPRADAAKRPMNDPGVAVYFRRKLNGERQVIACDKWAYADHNIRAICLCVAAMRAMARSGASELLDRAFTGFKALPAPGQTAGESWWTVLGVEAGSTAQEVKSAYRELAMRHHPDKGGSPEFWHRIVNAYEQAQQKGVVA